MRRRASTKIWKVVKTYIDESGEAAELSEDVELIDKLQEYLPNQ